MAPTPLETTWVTSHNFYHFKCNLRRNQGPAQANGLHNTILVFYSESDSVNNSYQRRSPFTYMGRPPVTRKSMSKKKAGIKWTKTAAILNSVSDGTSLMVGYQTADLSGYVCNMPFIFSSTWFHENGLQVEEVQWYTGVLSSLKKLNKKAIL